MAELLETAKRMQPQPKAMPSQLHTLYEQDFVKHADAPGLNTCGPSLQAVS